MKLLLLLSVALFAAEKPPVLVNGTAAVVARKLLTIQDAYIYRALTRFRDKEENAVKLEEGDELKVTVQKVVLEEIVLKEIQAYQYEGTTKKMVEKWLADAKKGRASSWENILKTFGLSEGQALSRLWDVVRVEEFIQKKVDTLTPIVTEAEARKYYRENESRFRGTSFDAMKPNIVLLLKKQQMQKGLEEWIQGLKEKYAVTNVLGG